MKLHVGKWLSILHLLLTLFLLYIVYSFLVLENLKIYNEICYSYIFYRVLSAFCTVNHFLILLFENTIY